MPTVATPSPEAATFSKFSTGTTDCYYENDILMFMGAAVVSINGTVGFNSVASSLSVTLAVEDPDTWSAPDVGTLWAFSLPKDWYIGEDPKPSLTPADFSNSNTPFYFCGILSDIERTKVSNGPKLITVSLVDPRDVLSGVQCVIGGFGISHAISGGQRWGDQGNIIDVYGYHNYGWESGLNQFGMPWYLVRESIEGTRVKVFDLLFEFFISDAPFTTKVPDWFRINDQVIDLMGLLQKVIQNSGGDFVCIPRKVASNTCVIEMRGIDRNNTDPLTQTELQEFVDARDGYVENFTMGSSLRTEPNSSIIVGGWRNKNYLAYPSEYKENFHINGTGEEDINQFPDSIDVRMFGGTYDTIEITEGVPNVSSELAELNSGGFIPFWGFDPYNSYYPLLEPFLPLDNYVWDKDGTNDALFRQKIPLCYIEAVSRTVREVAHTDVFISGDSASDSRPFSTVTSWKIQVAEEEGWTRGLPLNTEVLKAALISQSAFMSAYYVYFRDAAVSMGIGYPDFEKMEEITKLPSPPPTDPTELAKEKARAFKKLKNQGYILFKSQMYQGFTPIGNSVTKDDPTVPKAGDHDLERAKKIFLAAIYEAVKSYAETFYGKQWVVFLPYSTIMQRIWAGLPVPTDTNKPEIEYKIDNTGYWEVLPTELDGIYGDGVGSFAAVEEQQIRSRFMLEDGRFSPMAVIDDRPTGNGSFFSNGIYRAAIEDIGANEYAPNVIASDPKYFFCSCYINQPENRPDLAILSLPDKIHFDLENKDKMVGFAREFRRRGAIRHFWTHIQRNSKLIEIIWSVKATGQTFQEAATELVESWAERSAQDGVGEYNYITEPLLDLKVVSVPLTSTRVTYGPWYSDFYVHKGLRDLSIDQDLVPWNFSRSNPWDANLNIAGLERLSQTLSDVREVDHAKVTVSKLPEYGLASFLGYNSNLTGINVSIGEDGIRTMYNFSTYAGRPGTYKKSEYDTMYKNEVRTKPALRDPVNINIAKSVREQRG